jgi:hypothetical protein
LAPHEDNCQEDAEKEREERPRSESDGGSLLEAVDQPEDREE